MELDVVEQASAPLQFRKVGEYFHIHCLDHLKRFSVLFCIVFVVFMDISNRTQQFHPLTSVVPRCFLVLFTSIRSFRCLLFPFSGQVLLFTLDFLRSFCRIFCCQPLMSFNYLRRFFAAAAAPIQPSLL
jgi:hypothetical protein